MKTKLRISLIITGIVLFILMTLNSRAQDTPWWKNWVKHNDNPVMTGISGTWCNNVLFPVVIEDEAIFKIWFTGWTGAGARQVGYAESTDGLDWDIHPSAVLPGGAVADWNRHKFPGTVLRIDDTLRMWYGGSTNNYNTFAIGYAWSLDGVEWNIHPDPVLEKGDPGSWDDSGANFPVVHFDGIKYHMWYNDLDIGYATSDDGINWEKDTINSPVITKESLGGWCELGILSGGLIVHNDTIHILFSGFDGASNNPPGYFRTGYAWSTDFFNWTVENDGGPVFDVGIPGTWDSHGSAAGSVLFHDGQFKMWYSGQSSVFAIGYARQSVSCLPEGITFSTQAEIDSFQINYPYCNEIEGGVTIKGDDITNLNGLINLTSIGNLEIGRYDGGCPSLASLSGLDNLNSVGSIEISNNTSLLNLNGLNNLTSIWGSIYIYNNGALTSLSGLENIDTIYSLRIKNNDALVSLSGLNNLTALEGVWIWGSELVIEDNDALINLTGLESLTSLYKGIEGWGSNISIHDNDALISLQGIENVDTATIQYISLQNNQSLSICNVLSICHFLYDSTHTAYIYENATGCNSREEVDLACQIPVDEIAFFNKFSVYPNPCSGATCLRYQINDKGYLILDLYSISGQKIKRLLNEVKMPGTYEMEIDLREMPPGVYVVKFIVGDLMETKKVVVF